MSFSFNSSTHVFAKSYVSLLGAFFVGVHKLQTQFMSFKFCNPIRVSSTNQPPSKNFNSYWHHHIKLSTYKTKFIASLGQLALSHFKYSQKKLSQLKGSIIKTLSNQNGQITVVILPVVIVLMTIATSSGVATFAIIQKSKRDTYCHHVLLKLNSLYRDRLKDLYSLNKKIKAAHKNYSVAKKAMAAALASGQPAAIASAKYYLNFVKTIMYKLKYEQFIILKNSYDHFSKTQSKFKNDKTQWKTQIKPLMVRPIAKPIVSTYETVPSFQTLQTSSATWQYELQLLTYQFKVRGSCKASLKKKGSTWQPTIKTDRL